MARSPSLAQLLARVLMGCASTKSAQVVPASFGTVLPKEEPITTYAATGSDAVPAADGAGEVPTEEAPPPARPSRKRPNLIKAAKDGDLALVDESLTAGADIEQLGMWDNTPLLVACSYGMKDVALRLIERKAKIAVRNEHGCTPLHYAAVEGMQSVVQALLASAGEGGLDPKGVADLVNCGASKLYNRHLDMYAMRTPLGAAGESGFPAIIDSLIEVGAKVDDVGEDGRTAFWLACRNSKVPAARQLLRHGADPSTRDVEGTSALEAATREGNEDIVLLLLAHGPGDVNATSGSPLLNAVKKGTHRCVEALLTHGASLNPQGCDTMPLHAACKQGDEYLVSLLVQHGADPSAKDATDQNAFDLLRRRCLPDRQIHDLLKPTAAPGGAGATGETC